MGGGSGPVGRYGQGRPTRTTLLRPCCSSVSVGCRGDGREEAGCDGPDPDAALTLGAAAVGGRGALRKRCPQSLVARLSLLAEVGGGQARCPGLGDHQGSRAGQDHEAVGEDHVRRHDMGLSARHDRGDRSRLLGRVGVRSQSRSPTWTVPVSSITMSLIGAAVVADGSAWTAWLPRRSSLRPARRSTELIGSGPSPAGGLAVDTCDDLRRLISVRADTEVRAGVRVGDPESAVVPAASSGKVEAFVERGG